MQNTLIQMIFIKNTKFLPFHLGGIRKGIYYTLLGIFYLE